MLYLKEVNAAMESSPSRLRMEAIRATLVHWAPKALRLVLLVTTTVSLFLLRMAVMVVLTTIVFSTSVQACHITLGHQVYQPIFPTMLP